MDTPFPAATQASLFKPTQEPQLVFRRLSQLRLKCCSSRTKALAFKSKLNFSSDYCGRTVREPFANCRIWLWSEKERKTTGFSSVDVPEKANWVALLLYRSLLLIGIGLGATAPAMAKTASPASEVLVQKAVEKAAQETAETSTQSGSQSHVGEETTGKSAEKGAQVGSKKELAPLLSEEFWKDLELSKGSILTILKKILDGDPTNRDALECLAKTLLDNDDAAHTLKVVEKLELLEPLEMEWKYLRGMAYDIDGQFQLAKRIYQDILIIEPFSSKAIQGLVMAMDELGETDAAVEIAEEAMVKARDKNNVTEARNIGMLIGQYFMMKGESHHALEHYHEMMMEDPKDFRPHLCQGIIYSAMGEKAKADKEFKAYEKLCPKDYADRKYLDVLMSRAKQEGEKRFEQKQKEKYVKPLMFGKGKPAQSSEE